MKRLRFARLSMQCGSLVLAFVGFMALGLAWTQAVLASDFPPRLQRGLPSPQKGAPQDPGQCPGKGILAVNTGSYSGFTHRYAGLETLCREYRDRGRVVPGFGSAVAPDDRHLLESTQKMPVARNPLRRST